MSLQGVFSFLATALKVLATTAGLLGAVSAHATLIGDVVEGTLIASVETSVTAGFSPPSNVVGPGIEFTGEVTDSPGNVLEVGADLSDSQIVIMAALGPNSDVWGDLEGDGFSVLLRDLDWVGQQQGSITNVTLDQVASNPGPWSISAPSFGSDFVELSFFLTALDGMVNGSSNFAFQLAVEHTPTPVPEPTALALLAVGLAGMAVRRRRIH